MFSKAIGQISKGIFPIFARIRQGTRLGISIRGTGFFIDNEGTFITACHVIDGSPPGSTLLYGGNIPFRSITTPVEIEEIRRNNDRDIYIGRIERDYYESLELTDKSPPVGKTLCLCGYPLARMRIRANNVIDMSQVRPYYQPTFVLDGFQGSIRDSTGTNRNYLGFMTRDASYPGMSGGPVFDTNGIVWGMDVAELGRRIPRPNNPINISNGIVLKSEIISGFINANGNGE